MHTLARKVLVPLPTVLGIDLSITNEVALLWIAAAVTFALLAAACRKRDLVPRGWFQNLFDALAELVEKNVVRDNIGAKGRAWAPFLLTIFFFIFFGNLLGMVPVPTHFKSATSNINVTAGLALIVFGLTIFISVKHHGLLGFLGKFVPSGVPRWIAIMVIPIEIVSWLARPLSLAIRLFANMVAGHALILIFIGLLSGAAFYLKPLPLAGAVAMSCFELFVSFIQAFVFTLLAGMYISEALEEAH